MYCVFLYVHFFVNLGVASWITWKINHVTNTDVRVACGEGIKDPVGQQQCRGLLSDASGLLLWIIWVIIVIELCAYSFVAIIVEYCR